MSKKILIVDDDAMNLKRAEMILKKNGFEDLLQADSAEKAMATIKAEPVDLMLLDIEMPGMSGIEMLEHMSADGSYPQTKTMFLTGTVDDEVNAAMVRLGVIDVIEKPFLPAAFIEKIKSI